MAFKNHLRFDLLPDAGAFAAEHEVSLLLVSQRSLSVRIRYTANESAAGGFPGFRVRWYFPSTDPESADPTEALATVRVSALTVPADETTATLVERILIIHCEDLRDGQNASTVRVLEVPRDAVAVRVEPFEAGDTGDQGECAVDLGGVQ